MYANLADVIGRYGVDAVLMVADRDRDGTIDDAVVAQAIADASAEVDAYVGQRVRLPLDPVPSVLNRVAVDIVMYRLSLDAGATEERRARYVDAISLLKGIAMGSVSLGIPSDPNESSGLAEFFSGPVRFNRLL